MSKGKISLSDLVEEVVSEFVKDKPGLKASFEIENNVIVKGNYQVWKIAVKNLIENAIRYSSRADQPSVVFGRMENEYVYLVMDNGSQFSLKQTDTLLGVLMQRQFPPETTTLQRIMVKHGGRIWEIEKGSVGALFYFSFN